MVVSGGVGSSNDKLRNARAARVVRALPDTSAEQVQGETWPWIW